MHHRQSGLSFPPTAIPNSERVRTARCQRWFTDDAGSGLRFPPTIFQKLDTSYSITPTYNVKITRLRRLSVRVVTLALPTKNSASPVGIFTFDLSRVRSAAESQWYARDFAFRGLNAKYRDEMQKILIEDLKMQNLLHLNQRRYRLTVANRMQVVWVWRCV